MVVRRVCEPEEEEMRGEWRKLHDVELHKLYFTVMHSVPITEKRNSYRI
jgi:hypothetical protein